jgi:hypothetical protein
MSKSSLIKNIFDRTIKGIFIENLQKNSKSEIRNNIEIPKIPMTNTYDTKETIMQFELF